LIGDAGNPEGPSVSGLVKWKERALIVSGECRKVRKEKVGWVNELTERDRGR